MNPAHAHLIVNHIAVIGVPIAALLLVIAAARRSAELTKVSLVLVALVTIGGVAAFLTGEPAEEIVEQAAGVSRSAIEPHEEAATLAVIALSVLGAGAVVALVAFRRKPLPRWLVNGATVATIGVALVLAYTAWLGGHIRHTEIWPGATAPAGAQTDDDR